MLDLGTIRPNPRTDEQTAQTTTSRDRRTYRGPLAALEDADANKLGPSLQYPSDLVTSGKWMEFAAYRFSKPTRTSLSRMTSEYAGIARLPLPQQLGVGYQQDYTELELGAGGAYFLQQSGDRIQTTRNELETTRDWTAFSKLLDSTVASTILESFAANIIDSQIQVGEGRAGIRDTAFVGLGVARNPNLAALYKGTGFRLFSFSWKMIARNQQEAQSIQNLIRFFKIASSPTYTFEQGTGIVDNLLFDYPMIWDLDFRPDSIAQNLFSFVPAVLRNISVDYHSEGSPIYSTTDHPMSVTITTEFQEIAIFVREDIEKYNF